jgi:hypothetical protein
VTSTERYASGLFGFICGTLGRIDPVEELEAVSTERMKPDSLRLYLIEIGGR